VRRGILLAPSYARSRSGACNTSRLDAIESLRYEGAVTRIALILLLGVLGTDAAAADPRSGEAVFQSRCAQCHGASGRSDTPGARALKVRPLIDDTELARMTTAELAQAITSDPKHHGVGALDDLEGPDLTAVAAFVRELAKQH
jgi:mono/diheme cytochrome c family protein